MDQQYSGLFSSIAILFTDRHIRIFCLLIAFYNDGYTFAFILVSCSKFPRQLFLGVLLEFDLVNLYSQIEVLLFGYILAAWFDDALLGSLQFLC